MNGNSLSTCKHLLWIYCLLCHMSHKMVCECKREARARSFMRSRSSFKDSWKLSLFFFSLADLLRDIISSWHVCLCSAAYQICSFPIFLKNYSYSLVQVFHLLIFPILTTKWALSHVDSQFSYHPLLFFCPWHQKKLESSEAWSWPSINQRCSAEVVLLLFPHSGSRQGVPLCWETCQFVSFPYTQRSQGSQGSKARYIYLLLFSSEEGFGGWGEEGC